MKYFGLDQLEHQLLFLLGTVAGRMQGGQRAVDQHVGADPRQLIDDLGNADRVAGIGLDENTTVSPGMILIQRCVPLAIRLNAANGSPWEPVQTMQILLAGSEFSWSGVMKCFSGMAMMPSLRAICTTFSIDRPKTATLRPQATAASRI